MSLQALTWAMEHAPIEDPTCRSVLFVQANAADEEGRNAFLSVDRISYCTGFSERTIRRALDRMVAEGIIREQPDTSLRDAKIKDPGRRPTVYELAMHRRRPSYAEHRAAQLSARGVPESHPSEGVSESHPWGVTETATGVTVSTEGCQSGTQPVLDPSKDPTTPNGVVSAPAATADDDPDGTQLQLVPESPAKPRRRTRIPADWTPSPELRAKTAAKAPGMDIDAEVEKFVGHHRAKGQPMLDWDLAWLTTWVGNWRPTSGRLGRKPYRNTGSTGESIAAKWAAGYKTTPGGTQ